MITGTFAICFRLIAERTNPNLLRSWMRAIVDLGDLADGQLCIPLRRGEALVAEQFLDGAQVGALFQHVRAKGMAQRVRMDVCRQSVGQRDVLHDATDAAGGEAAMPAKAQIREEEPVRTSLLPRVWPHAPAAMRAGPERRRHPAERSAPCVPLPRTRMASLAQWMSARSIPTSSALRIPQP